MIFLSYILLGAFAGLVAGVFGVGGGIVIVPALVFMFAHNGFSPDIAMHLAIGTSLSTILFTSLSAISVHHKKGKVNWALATNLSIGMLLGGFIGAFAADFYLGIFCRKFLRLTPLWLPFKCGLHGSQNLSGRCPINLAVVF